MLQIARWLCLTLALGLLPGCIGSKVTIAPDPAIDPARHRTFAWDTPALKSRGRSDRFYYIDRYIRRGVTRALEQRGYREVPRASADFVAVYRLSRDISVDQGGLISPRDTAQESFDAPVEPGSTAIYNHPIAEQISRVRVELILFDTADDKTLWRASLSKILEREIDSADAAKALLADDIPRLLRGLPHP